MSEEEGKENRKVGKGQTRPIRRPIYATVTKKEIIYSNERGTRTGVVAVVSKVWDDALADVVRHHSRLEASCTLRPLLQSEI